ncbi:transcription initiation factor TFIID subunit 12 [Akanthomyces lecanii RCEF 1005]|uniref:Transcription initiation factor TFIID subunit 12 n=1 Tax=Akanthomyces lecanii RCEF 1005 TaxID=1081108 RepID=A0A168H4Y9_CORDF|nr:transcription initiation factor TFIID subunit 12 [Akanthomyces lecanii RCEF 1005]
MNNPGGQSQQGQAGQAGQAGQPPPRPPPMYQPAQIRNLPLLSEDEKLKYEHGVTGLWNRMNNSAPNSPEHVAARNKIIEFSRMLITKIQGRRAQAQQQHGQQAGAQRPQGQAAQQQQATTQQKPAQQPTAAAGKPAGNATGGAAASALATAADRASVTALTQPKVPDRLMAHVNKLTFKAPQHLTEKSPAEAAKWIEDLKVRYGRALMTMEAAKNKIANMDKVFHERAQAGNPLKDEELRQYREHKDKQQELHNNGQKWIETVRKQQESVSGPGQGQNASATQNKTNGSGTPTQQNQNAAASVNASVEATKNQQQMAGQQQQPATNTPTPQQQQARLAQNAAAQGGAAIKQEPQHPAPVNTALANAQAQTPAQGAARVGTPQSATAQAPGGPTRALSHSAAMSLANQRAAAQPANAALANQNQQQQQVAQQQQAAASAATAASGSSSSSREPAHRLPQQQGHPHAHPTQQPPASLQSKMPIQKHLPERATAVPQGVTLGGGVAAGRPTLSQGGGTLGGVMNQPAMAKVPAYSHDAEGDHVLSKKKLDELVRQVCGAPSEGSDGNLLTPEVEESVLNMADSFVDNVLHAACRNSKERGSKVLEIRDIQLVLERTYNIRVPGYSSDELRTVRKVQPSAGWIAKMSAVQAAKVMPGKGE